jgi:hypothetical protein
LVTNLEGAVPASHHPPPPHLVAPRDARLHAAQSHPAVAHGRLERCYRGCVRTFRTFSSFLSQEKKWLRESRSHNCVELLPGSQLRWHVLRAEFVFFRVRYFFGAGWCIVLARTVRSSLRTDFQKLRSNLCRRRCACVCVLRMQQCSPQVRPIRTFGMRAISPFLPFLSSSRGRRPCHGLAGLRKACAEIGCWERAPLLPAQHGAGYAMLGRKAGCEGVRTDFIKRKPCAAPPP